MYHDRMPNVIWRIAAALLTLAFEAGLAAMPLPREGERWTRLRVRTSTKNPKLKAAAEAKLAEK